MDLERRLRDTGLMVTALVAIALGFRFHALLGPGASTMSPAVAVAEHLESRSGTGDETQTGRNPLDEVDELVGSMSVRDKIGQLLIVDLRDENGRGAVEADARVKDLLDTYRPGGVVLYRDSIMSVEQVCALIAGLQRASRIPLMVAVDQEGGVVRRLREDNVHATPIPAAETVGRTGDADLARRLGAVIGSELRALGFTMNFAPVADVRSRHDSIIGSRSFGDDPRMVGELAAAMVDGMQSHGVSAVVKHFPGHGDTSTDTHSGAAVILHDLDRLRRVEFPPFSTCVTVGVDGIMTAHIALPQVTSNAIPATFSAALLTGILREELGHDRLIVTDALIMGSATGTSGTDQTRNAGLSALLAGADMLLRPGELEELQRSLLNAVEERSLPMERLDRSVRRILTVKRERGWDELIPDPDRAHRILGSDAHRAVVDEILDRALQE